MIRHSLRSALVLGFALVLASTGCHKSDDNPPPPPLNPPVQPAQPLTLSGTVVDATTGQAIAGASVTVNRAGGVTVTTLTTSSSGAYTLDVSAQTDTQLFLKATAATYGYGNATAVLDKVANIVRVPVITLAKLGGTSGTATPAAGGLVQTTSSEAKGTVQAAISVPPNAVSASTTLTVAAVPVNGVPQPANPTTQNLYGVVSVLPVTVTFGQPVELTFPLPAKLTAGYQITAVKLDTTTGLWTPLSVKAAVDSTGLAAKLSVTSAGYYGILDAIQTTLPALGAVENMDPDQAMAPPETRTFALRSGTTTAVLNQTTTFTRIASSGEPGTDIWAQNLLSQVLGITFGTSQITQSLAYPQLPTAYNRDGRNYNPDRPNEQGVWEYRWIYDSATTSGTGTIVTNTGSLTFTISALRWKQTSSGWYWVMTTGGSGL